MLKTYTAVMFLTVYYGFVLNALYTVVGFGPMRCFPKLYS